MPVTASSTAWYRRVAHSMFGGGRPRDFAPGPIRGELLGPDGLADRVRELARAQRLAPRPGAIRRAPLLDRLRETHRILDDARARLSTASSDAAEIGPAAEWLLDNFHVVAEQIQEVRESLPRGYYRELPELAGGPLAGYPRVYEIAVTLIAHAEGRVDAGNTDLVVRAFQTVTPLSMGELWAIPAMLRLAAIENVRRMTLRTLQRLDELDEANRWIARIRAAGDETPDTVGAVLSEFVASPPPLTPAFVSHFLQRLQHLRAGEGPFTPFAWIEQWMGEDAFRAEDAAARASERLALTQLVMENSITSLRAISHMNWRAFVEQRSLTHAVLSDDPSGFYARMTFASRDRYRHVVERVAKRTGLGEPEVARRAVELARAGTQADTGDGRAAHVGFYLVDEGLAALERATGYRQRLRERVHRGVLRHPNLVFFGAVLVATLAVLAAMVWFAGPPAAAGWVAVLLLALVPANDVAISIVNQLAPLFLPPRILSRLDFHGGEGIPETYRTAVVVPTLFADVADVREALENLEVQFLANRDPHLHFAILSDFTDAPTETCVGDDAIVEAAVSGIRALNARYAGQGDDVFYLFHRPRRWNARQQTWMGWERKRGKLKQFDRFVRRRDDGAFSVVVGNTERLRGIRYVITLDADTVLPPDTASALIGAMAHPLNAAVYDPAAGRVVRGYGILQPRVSVSLPSAHRSRFAEIHSGHPGVDPYTTAVSDVYQDLFGEGSFTGKGIYDVNALDAATSGRFPDNTLLSHDLIEGIYARAGLATDIVLYDEYPTRYLTFARRKHRWIRGDWQLLRWLMPYLRGPDGREKNQLSLLSRWKIFDNLRRSVLEIAHLLFLIGAWTVLPGSPLRWTAIALLAIAAPWGIALLLAVLRPPLDKSWPAYYAAVARDARTSAQQVTLALAFLPHQAWFSADAIVRTLWRLVVSRSRLLEWQTASQVESAASGTALGTWRAMWPATLLGVGALGVLAAHAADEWPVAVVIVPLALLWAGAPVLARALDAPAVPRRRRLSPEAQAQALRYARLHWAYFERFVGANTHWLAPDNFQDDPTPVVAMRTSPTNIGLQLLATVSAFDLAFITIDAMTERLELAFRSLERMRRYRGHFYNWYDLHDLHVLEPAYVSTVDSGNLAGHLVALRQACLGIIGRAPGTDHRARLQAIADRAYAYAMEMDFGFLFDDERKLFAIGYQESSHTLDASYYDLLASEARLASFVAIAKNDVPVEHWFHLGRSLTHAAGATTLVSWSGSMFEYLMPGLVMESVPFTLLDQTIHGAVRRQVDYGRERGVPWGVSESAYNVRDRFQTYQYRAFGVPDLALKRGLGRDLVVAPYALMLATLVHPRRALANLAVLEAQGALGELGFHDALDYTRPDPGARAAIVQNFMAHHIGMSLVALTNLARDDIWQRRFHSDALVRSAELLLHERIPRRLVPRKRDIVSAELAEPAPEVERPAVREIDTPDTPQPHIALLGHVPYTAMVSQSGAGYSRYEGLAVTRWRADGTRDHTGQFCYVRDLTHGRLWSAGYQPVCAEADWYRAYLATDRVMLHRADGDIETRTEIAVVPADAAEVRQVTVTNNGATPCEVELTSYAEVVLAPPDADRAHPAFGNLFVETEWHPWCTALTASRRPRSDAEPRVWCAHVIDAGPGRVGTVSYETDRERFLGRGRTTRHPAALDAGAELSGATGAVLDPIFAIRVRLRLDAGESASVAFTTIAAATPDRLFALADRYHDSHAAQRALALAWAGAQVDLHELGITPSDAAVYQELAGHLLYRDAALRPPPAELAANRGSQPLLWAHGISGDWPILLATIDSADGLPTMRQLLAAHQYWRQRGMIVDLVILNLHPPAYLQDLHDRITSTVLASSESAQVDRPGGVFVRRHAMVGEDGVRMLRATARVVLTCDGRPLGRMLPSAVPIERYPADDSEFVSPERLSARRTPPMIKAIRRIRAALLPEDEPDAERTPADGSEGRQRSRRAALAALAAPGPAARASHHAGASPLLLDNGCGGLTPQGEYEIRVAGRDVPPAPWANVIANARGGFVVTERGGGCAWVDNSYFYRLTPWHNDPVSDPPGEVLYLRDEESNEAWSATPAPMGGGAEYTVRHGAGRSSFEHRRGDLAIRLEMGLAGDDPVKVSLLHITNHGARARRLSLTAYAEWTLGTLREHTQHQVHTAFRASHGAILARNFFGAEFAGYVAFCAVSQPVVSYTGDRCEFLGRNGSLAQPRGVRAAALSGATGAAMDPCAALRMAMELAPGETRQVAVLLGAGASEEEALRLLDSYRPAHRAATAMDRTIVAWEQRLGVVRVSTPDPTFDAMVNRWALYQALSCRMWARTAVYQSSGAYGFRDQLQDVMAFVYAEPAVARAHLLRAASRQFVEGDVQHWWHPPSGRGVRTRISDDLVWLPYVVDHYVRVTGDAAVLEETVPFLTMRSLEPHEEEVYDLPQVAAEQGTVYEHCVRALRRACTAGAHGLPLIGSGDWNDGMNRVGIEGRGESVWLAWFLVTTLRAFALRAEERGDHAVASEMRRQALDYAAAAEQHGWDGDWYRRAYFDDGTPLGSASNDECRIDSIAQSWSVISGAGDPARRARAMQSLEAHLVQGDARLLMLLTPPFDHTAHDPGYIKGYLPGVRENGAQYTHAALWAVLATALLGDGDRAFAWFQMLNPFTHARTPEQVALYRVEPYVVAADVYTADAQVGRGGWTWYTGSASWMYRVALESILGFTKRGDTLVLDPCVPRTWPAFSIQYRYGASLYAITVQEPARIADGAAEVTVNGTVLPLPVIPLVDDGGRYDVVVRRGKTPAPQADATPGRSVVG